MKTVFNLVLLKLIFLLFSYNSNAQQPSIQWGEENQLKNPGIVENIIGHDVDGYYVYKNLPLDYRVTGNGVEFINKTVIDKHNLNHALVSRIEVQNKIDDKEVVVEYVCMIDENKFIVFQSKHDTKTKHKTLYITNIDKNGKATEPLVIDEITHIKGEYVDRKFKIEITNDKSRYLVYHVIGFDKNRNEKINYKLYSLDSKLIWEKQLDIPNNNEEFTIIDYIIDSKNNLFIYGTFGAMRRHKAFVYYPEQNHIEEIKINWSNVEYTSDISFLYKDDFIYFIGFYYDNNNTHIAGLIYNKINCSTLASEIVKNISFSEDDLKLFAKQQKLKKVVAQRYNISIRNILYNPNGDIYFIGEEYRITAYIKNGTPGLTYSINEYNMNEVDRFVYVHNDIVVVKVKNNLELDWVKRVPKLQVSTYDKPIYSSYTLAYDDNVLYFLYNDNVKNTSPNTKPIERGSYLINIKKTKKMAVTLAKVTKEGDIITELFSPSKQNGKTIFKPNMYYRLNKDQTLVFAEYGWISRFGILNIK